jgi:hypothetical protein
MYLGEGVGVGYSIVAMGGTDTSLLIREVTAGDIKIAPSL